ncbi:hypothetical protein E2562_023461 [Oryza meyeriana var. granulata]|uniref:Uncharacterized protein n=1 Tax=Oryza meyeriana var. granulata TaxID=110450 RepID=A0A6G1FB82_9ORYZ|nr:hypothetical protein E2562_023461 [Oryza meyeriana var. granulata]
MCSKTLTMTMAQENHQAGFLMAQRSPRRHWLASFSHSRSNGLSSLDFQSSEHGRQRQIGFMDSAPKSKQKLSSCPIRIDKVNYGGEKVLWVGQLEIDYAN